MPSSDPRDRSRSPLPRSKPSSGGFKWKDKTASKPQARSSSDRPHRERSPKYDTPHRPRTRSRSRSPARLEHRKPPPPQPEAAEPAPPPAASSIAAKFGARAAARHATAKPAAPAAPKPGADSALAPPLSTAVAVPAAPVPRADEPMILVYVNDRLGTKAGIPCLASDPVKAFKAMVAARIGRRPHEILIKRQGERPFKDALTLEDYGVGNGVQLDLELDTGE